MLNYQKNLGDIIPNTAKTFGDKVGLIFKDREFTYKELDELTNRLANSLLRLGVKKGDRVSLYSQNCWQWLVSYYAVGKLGAVVNPVNVMLTPEEVRYVVDDCDPREGVHLSKTACFAHRCKSALRVQPWRGCTSCGQKVRTPLPPGGVEYTVENTIGFVPCRWVIEVPRPGCPVDSNAQQSF